MSAPRSSTHDPSLYFCDSSKAKMYCDVGKRHEDPHEQLAMHVENLRQSGAPASPPAPGTRRRTRRRRCACRWSSCGARVGRTPRCGPSGTGTRAPSGSESAADTHRMGKAANSTRCEAASWWPHSEQRPLRGEAPGANHPAACCAFRHPPAPHWRRRRAALAIPHSAVVQEACLRAALDCCVLRLGTGLPAPQSARPRARQASAHSTES